MAYQSLYRRYRPRRFDEVRGQEHVVGALRNAVATNSVTHAYLFSGPRGTGKTSTARILAKALNCENLQRGEPCCECTPCQDMEAGRSFDLFELDAASNNGVDAIRDLIERTAVGSPGRTKVYILDEVHMLSPAASNALLKTLEEPPGHVRFVLATTDPQKVLPTIRSRTQHFEFQLLSADELERYVRWIISDADLEVDETGIAWAVRQGRGSARDTLSALDQVVAAGGVVERTEPVEQLFEALAAKDSGKAILAVADALSQGHDPRVLAKVFLDSLRDTFLLSLGADVPHMMADDAQQMGAWARQIGTPLLTRAMEAIGSAMVDMRQAADPRVPLEVALVRLTSPAEGSVAELSERIEKLERALDARESRPDSDRPSGPEQVNGQSAGSEPGRGSAESSRSGMSHAARARAELARHTQHQDGEAGPDRKPTRPAARPSQNAGGPPVPPQNAGGPPPVPPSARPQPAEPPAEPISPSTPPPSDESQPLPTAATSGELTVADLQQAMDDVVLGQIRGVTKAIYAQGHFASASGSTAVFVVENAPTRERAEKSRAEIESILSAHFAKPVTLVVTDKDSSPSAGGGSPGAPPADRRGPETSRSPGSQQEPAGDHSEEPPVEVGDFEDEEELMRIDVTELEDAKGVAETGLDRLLSAFPGAKVIEANEDNS